jgi:hypothetical protein
MAEKAILLRELDVVFDAGVPEQTLTLYPTDAVKFSKNGDIVVTFREKSFETIRMFGAHIRWYSMRERVLKQKAETAE